MRDPEQREDDDPLSGLVRFSPQSPIHLDRVALDRDVAGIEDRDRWSSHRHSHRPPRCSRVR
jgi:hypothetical protein